MALNNNIIEFSKPFITHFQNVMQTMAMVTIKADKPFFKQDAISKGDISSVIGLSGTYQEKNKTVEYKSVVSLSFPYETYFNIANKVFGEVYTSITPDIHDLASELINIVTGNSKRDLEIIGMTSNMAIPSTIQGSNHLIKYPADTQVIVIPFNSEIGQMFLEICLI